MICRPGLKQSAGLIAMGVSSGGDNTVTGTRTKKHDPLPSVLSTPMEPPCAKIISRDIARPSPVLRSLKREDAARSDKVWNASNRCVRSLLLIPPPWSRTANSIHTWLLEPSAQVSTDLVLTG